MSPRRKTASSRMPDRLQAYLDGLTRVAAHADRVVPWGTTPKVSCCPSSARAKRRLASGNAGLRGIDDSGAKIEFAHLSAGFEVDDRDSVVIDTRCDLAIGGDGEVGDGGFLVNADAGIVAERNGRAVFRPSAGQSKHMDVVVHSAEDVEALSIGREDDSEERVGT